MTQTPLTEANPRSIDELFAADPLSLTDTDVDRITAELRKKRIEWEAEEDKKNSAPKRKDAPSQLNLDQLDL